MKVLIVKLSSIGDVVHTLPALESLSRGFKDKGIDAKIDWLVEEAASSVLEGHPLINKLIVVKRGWGRNLRANREAARALKETGYDLVLDFQGLMKSAVWVYFSKAKRRVGFSNGREMSHLFYNEKLPAYDIERHAVDRYLDLARYAGGATGEAVFNLETGKARESVKKKLRTKGVDGPFFVIVARARWATKMWKDERFVELAKRLIERRGLKVVFAGSPADREGLERMVKAVGKDAANLSGETDLKELYELFRLSEFAVTVDSGPMHIAAASGAKIAALFGPTAPWRTGPYGKANVIVRKSLSCSPCFKRQCVKPRCMDEITVEDVLEAVDRLG